MFSAIARGAVARPRLIATLSLVVFLIAAGIGGPAAGKLHAPNSFIAPDSQSARAQNAIERVTGAEAFPGVLALVNAPPASATVSGVSSRLRRVRGVADLGAPIVSRSGRQTVLPVSLTAAASDDPDDTIKRVQAAVPAGVLLGGADTAAREVNEQASKDLGVAEAIAFPLLAIISLLIFRGVAALLPLVVGGISVVGTFLVLAGINTVLPLSNFALNLVIGVGLGLAVDYSLLIVWRFREELAGTTDVTAALITTLNTAGRAVTYSALTVAAALATLTIFPQRFLISMGIGGAVVTLIAGLSSLIVLPPLLVLGARRFGRVAPEPAGTGRWYALAHGVMKRPALVAGVVMIAMLAVASPTLGVTWSGVDASVLPHGQSARVVQERMSAAFPARDGSTMVLAAYAAGTDRVAVDAYAHRVAAVPGVLAAGPPRYLGSGIWELALGTRGDPIYAAAQRTLRQIEAVAAPFAIGIDGTAAQFQDEKRAVADNVVPALIVLVVLTFTLLWLMTGSVILPLKALLMNALTIGVATGVLVFVFQHGRLSGLLDYTSQGGIEQSDFLVLVAVGFALSTDYGVLLLARIKEARDHGHDNREAIALGLQRTGRIVSAAAILMAVAIGAFATSHVIFLKEIGIGAVVGVLVDAFVVRCALVPALMVMLGELNWWSPRPLAALHRRIGLSEGPAVPAPAAAAD